MALNAYLRLRADSQGDILGSVTLAPHAGKILVTAVEHGLISPRDVATGQASGKRQHSPIKITKPLDRATAPLYRALVYNESIIEAQLQLFRPGPSGQEEAYFTIDFWTGFVTSIDLLMPNNEDPTLQERDSFEVVSFVYQRIKWSWAPDGGLTAEDTWEHYPV
jgi:type VI secretion system secreted protein Hcp